MVNRSEGRGGEVVRTGGIGLSLVPVRTIPNRLRSFVFTRQITTKGNRRRSRWRCLTMLSTLPSVGSMYPTKPIFRRLLANCQTHLEVKAFMGLQSFAEDSVQNASFEVEVHTRDGVLRRDDSPVAAAAQISAAGNRGPTESTRCRP
jgi:hypothetical protein